MHLPVLWLMLALLTKSIASGEQTCSPTITDKGTFYKVPDFGEPHCTPHWIDAENNNTLANGDEKNDSLVVSSNITTLHTCGCHNAVMYVLDCYPSTRLNKMVTCVANCSESAGFSGTPDNTEGKINHWVIPVICIFMTSCAIGVVIYSCRRQRRNQNGL